MNSKPEPRGCFIWKKVDWPSIINYAGSFIDFLIANSKKSKSLAFRLGTLKNCFSEATIRRQKPINRITFLPSKPSFSENLFFFLFVMRNISWKLYTRMKVSILNLGATVIHLILF